MERYVYSDVDKVCKDCLTCTAYKSGGRRSKLPLKHITVGGPFGVGVHLMKMPLTFLGNWYDYHTKWVEAHPLSARQ